MTRALAPDGTDAFNVISERIALLQRPVTAILPLAAGDRLPASEEFRLFAHRLTLLTAAWEDYLTADLRATRMAAVDAQREAKAVGASTVAQ